MEAVANEGKVLRRERARALLGDVAVAHAPAVLTSSFGAEDMVLVDMIARDRLPIRVVTLDTGRLPQETHDLIERVRRRYAIPIDVFLPEASPVEAFVREHGPNPFYEDLSLRKRCCDLRKTQPLRRALRGARAWVTGLRREQSPTRSEVPFQEFDAERGIAKFNPLADWSERHVWGYLREHDVPWNALHDRGYPSIGCAPCTRAVAPGEDSRAGRWWWESAEHKECGLHRRPVIRLVAAGEEIRS